MKPNKIKEILTMTAKIRAMGGNNNPCFAGDAGIGKSEICQQWAKENGYELLDIRCAYFERPDVLGNPTVIEVNGQYTTIHALPDFLPKGTNKVLLLLEEPNRADSSVTNTLMQLLTDRKIHKWTAPEECIVAACINPDTGGYTVNTMDFALKNRFDIYDVKYDHATHVNHMKEVGYDERIVSFVDGGIWLYKEVGAIAENGQYVSPRSFKKLNNAILAGAEHLDSFSDTCKAILGEAGPDFVKHLNDNKPILLADFLKNEKKALKDLKKMCEAASYEGDKISLTVNSLTDGFKAGKIKDKLVVEVVKLIDADQAVALLNNTMSNLSPEKYKQFIADNPEMMSAMKKRKSGKLTAA